MNTDGARRLLRSRVVWGVIGCVLVVFALSYAFVRMKSKECELLCGEASIGKATYRVGGGIARYSSKAMASTCDCGVSKPAAASR